MADKFKVGEKVRCLGRVRTIMIRYPDVPGGFILDKPVEGFLSWNAQDLRKYKKRKRRGLGT